MVEERGTVGIPAAYFLKMARHDYCQYKYALAREFFQNSIDAGAKKIIVEGNSKDRSITVIDDGCGMDKDVLSNKLLVLGGSHKAQGSVGAFGKAKELLFFSWMQYSIRTQDWLVQGKGAEYSIRQMDRVKGTTCKITIQSEESFADLMQAFDDVAGKMQTSSKIFVDGDRVQCQLYRGTLVKEWDWAKVYLTKSNSDYYMHVRIEGVWMFDRYTGEGDIGTVVVELTKSSLELLNSNRDGLKSSWSAKLDRFCRDLAVNSRSALKKEPQMQWRYFEGNGEVAVTRREILDEIANEQAATPEEIASATAIAMAKVGNDFELSLSRVDKVLEGVIATDINEWLDSLEQVMGFIGYKPDFVVRHEDRQASRVDRYMRQQNAAVLVKIWTETVRQVLIDLGKFDMKFVAGFTFDDEVEAQYVMRNDKVYFLLNPWKVGKDGGWMEKPLSSRRLLISDLKDKAIHEVTHGVGYDGHDEKFVSAMASIRAKTELDIDSYSKISRIKAS